jgi:hypothetical protein
VTDIINLFNGNKFSARLSRSTTQSVFSYTLRSNVGYSPPVLGDLHKQNNVYKNFYKMELDDLVKQKSEQKRAER